MANTVNLATKFLPVIDDIYRSESVTELLDTNTMADFTNSAEVKVLKVATTGLGNYSRTNGYPKGDISATWETMRLSQERGKEISIDRMDDEEMLGVVFGSVTGNFMREWVIPELDAYLRKRRVLACGPTNLSALLSTLQTGFKTVAIEKRSGELWQLLSAFKVQFDKFAAILEKTGKKLQEAQNTIEEAGRRTRTISNKLRTVADIGDDEAERLLSDGD